MLFRSAVLTRCVDHGRPAYGYEPRAYPRRTCFVFSLNDIEFMQDATGDRRYWPISTIRERVDVEGLRRDRDQILAEALARLKAGEQHWPTWEEEERRSSLNGGSTCRRRPWSFLPPWRGSSPRSR